MISRYPVVHPWRPAPRMAQLMPPVNYVTTGNVDAFMTQAKSSIKVVADIARQYELTDEERRIIDSEVGKVSGFTLPMAEIPQGPSWLTVGAALLAGGLLGSVLL